MKRIAIAVGVAVLVFAVAVQAQTSTEQFAKDIAVDSSGNVYVTGYTARYYGGSEFATIKYDSSGVQQWAALYNWPEDMYGGGAAIAVDPSGNVYVTGSVSRSEGGNDFATIKYDTNGNRIWVATYNAGPGNTDDKALAIAVDPSGNVYVTGYGFGGEMTTGCDWVTIKYPSTYAQEGDPAWVTKYNREGASWDEPRAIALDTSGNVYVTGLGTGSETFGDIITIKYDAITGSLVWEAIYTGPESSAGCAFALAVDSSGNVYVTGYTGAEYATIKYTSYGQQSWIASYTGPAFGLNQAIAIAVDSSGNVYVTGTSYGGEASYSDYATVKYGPAGALIWEARYNGPWPDEARDLVLAEDSSGVYVYVTGMFKSDLTNTDFATIKYNAISGTQVWVARYNGAGNSYDNPVALALDSYGNIYVTGFATGIKTRQDYATVKYDSSGNQVWAANYTGPNEAPRANAGTDQIAVGPVTLDGSRSTDPNGKSDIDGYTWKENGAVIAEGVTPTVILSAGVHTITLTVTDKAGASSSDEVIITVFESAEAALSYFINTAREMTMGVPIQDSIISKLSNALQTLQLGTKNDQNIAINILEAFINECEAQWFKHLTYAQEKFLTSTAQVIILALQQ